jgi:hypothetical protein
MKTINTYFLLLILVVTLSSCVGIGGEKIALSHDPLAMPSQRYSEKLAIQKPDEGVELSFAAKGKEVAVPGVLDGMF